MKAPLPVGHSGDYRSKPRRLRVVFVVLLLAALAVAGVSLAAGLATTKVFKFTVPGTTVAIPQRVFTRTLTVPTVTVTSTATVTVTATAATTTATTSTTTASPAAVWQWNAQAATVDPNSAAKIASFQSYAVSQGTYFTAAVAWVNAPAGTPAYAIPVTGQSVKSITAPVPVGTKPGNTFDQSLTVHDEATGIDYDFGLAQYSAATGKIGSTDGAAPVPAGSAFETGPDSANAARFPLRQGPITPADVASGVINHPLVFTMPNVGPAPNPYPANTTVGYPSNTGLPLGTWLRLDPSVNVASLGLPPFETMVAVALQKYGMFLRDIGSTLSIIGTDQINQGGNGTDWPAVGVTLPISTPSGVPYARTLAGAFPWSRLQVLEPPAH